MSENTPGASGSTGVPAAALQVAGSGACCGSPFRAVGEILPPAGVTASGDPCCGTRQAARVADSCCGAQAKDGAIAAGQGCCS